MVLSSFLGGAAGSASVNIVIRAIDQYSKQFKKLDKAVVKQKSGFKKLTGFLKSSGIGYTILAAAAVGFGVSAVKSAIDAELAFQQFNLALGETASIMLGELRRASKGLVSDFDLMVSANKALALGISKDKLPKLLEVATARAKVFGRTTTEAFNDIAIGVGRQSRMILDNLGIILDLDTAYADYARTIGKTADDLTELEKKEALVNAIIKESEGLLAAQAFLLETNAEKLQRLSAGWDNFRVAVGTGLIDFGPTIRAELNAQLDIFRIYTSESKSFNKSMDDRAIAITNLFNKAKEASEELRAIENFFKGISDVKLLGESEKDVEIAEKAAEINRVKLQLAKDGNDANSGGIAILRGLEDELEILELQRAVEFEDIKKVAQAKGNAFIAEKTGLEVNLEVFNQTIIDKLIGWEAEKTKIKEVQDEVARLAEEYRLANKARSELPTLQKFGIGISDFVRGLGKGGQGITIPALTQSITRPANSSVVNISIDNVNGIDAEEISRALSDELNARTSL